MILISNGHYKFILGPAANEINERGRLVGFITGGYPTKCIKWLISTLSLGEIRIVKRLLERDEALPELLIYPLWISELLMQSSSLIQRRRGTSELTERVSAWAMELYAKQSVNYVNKSKARIYHYRSGYGLQSVPVAKDKDMVALCDHSIAHPAALNFLIANNGRLPDGKINPQLNKMWTNVLKDIDQADHIVVNSDFVKKTFVDQGVNPSKVDVIYTGIDDAFMDRVPNRMTELGQKIPVRLMFAGSLGKRKGGKILIEALQRLNRFSWELDIIANIESDIASTYKEFLSSPNVKISGLVPISELPKRMSEADIFIFPSLAEGSARVVFMALACGCYVITTPNSGSIVQDGVHGSLVPPSDADALAVVIQKAIEDRGQLGKIGQRNAALIRASYRQSHYGENLIKLYDRLLEK